MRILPTKDSHSSAQEIGALLEEKGIPVYFGSTGARRPSPSIVWVCIDSQYDDALALLTNPEHEVSNPIDVQEYYAASEKLGYSSILYSAVKVFLVVAVFFALVVFIGYKQTHP